jgi:hypothetical protein
VVWKLFGRDRGWFVNCLSFLRIEYRGVIGSHILLMSPSAVTPRCAKVASTDSAFRHKAEAFGAFLGAGWIWRAFARRSSDVHRELQSPQPRAPACRRLVSFDPFLARRLYCTRICTRIKHKIKIVGTSRFFITFWTRSRPCSIRVNYCAEY